MREASGQLADGLHLLGLAQLFLRLAQRAGRLLLGRDVPAARVDQFAFRGRHPQEPAEAAVLVQVALLDGVERRVRGGPERLVAG